MHLTQLPFSPFTPRFPISPIHRCSYGYAPYSAFRIPHSDRTLVHSYGFVFDVHSAFAIPHSAFFGYLRTLVPSYAFGFQFIPHSAFRIPHWSRPLVPAYAFEVFERASLLASKRFSGMTFRIPNSAFAI